ncbi:hypothetical protein PLESTB_001102400 [Pleodorina starrii]|uniref:Uncharacterized protein n=1 Tax=Pleodorina starrii TaxID=330485 RepID=A0A9W6F5E5_9CHLO|nr:hypothetical protein PLESTM_001337200 [Pleodorina starrii]GLC56415.1 hypothetical protein PLESTB_001102400 [Pleodorina starrii]GLC68915.1 hypothetical protein PLESTF_000758600 [Pleodorina starrii]
MVVIAAMSLVICAASVVVVVAVVKRQRLAPGLRGRRHVDLEEQQQQPLDSPTASPGPWDTRPGFDAGFGHDEARRPRAAGRATVAGPDPGSPAAGWFVRLTKGTAAAAAVCGWTGRGSDADLHPPAVLLYCTQLLGSSSAPRVWGFV